MRTTPKSLCTNILYASSNTSSSIQVLGEELEKKFDLDYRLQDTPFQIECEFDSEVNFPFKSLEYITAMLLHDDSDLHIRCLSYDIANEYHALFIYRDGGWEMT